MDNVTELRQQLSFLNRSIWTLNHSKTTFDEFADLNERVMRAMTNIMALNDSTMDLLSETGLVKSTITMLNDSIMAVNVGLKSTISDFIGGISAVNNSVMTVMSNTVALAESVLELNASQFMLSSMFPDWPDAIACNLTKTSYGNYESLGTNIHYLVTVATPLDSEDPESYYYIYRWIEDDRTSTMIFRSDGSWYTDPDKSTVYDNSYSVTSICYGKSIQQISYEGFAFNFVATLKL